MDIQPATTLRLKEDDEIIDQDGLSIVGDYGEIYNRATAITIVQRYNAHEQREQVLADVAEMATELVRVLANYNTAYALVRQIRAVLKKARDV